MELQALRQEIDRVDQGLLRLFRERMDLAAQVADYKTARNLPIFDPRREQEKLRQVEAQAGEDLAPAVHTLYDLLFDLSRSHQRARQNQPSPLRQRVQDALEKTPDLFPQGATVACQGTEGAFSQEAAQRLFKRPDILRFQSFEAVFRAVEGGLCRYGILPLENSTAGSVTRVYDGMLSHRFHILRSVRLKVSHSLLVPPGVKREDIKEIYSHQQALDQCAGFLEGLGKHVRLVPWENTAAAAQAVAMTGRKDVAAIASHQCAALYGLEELQADIQDYDNNYTRFICVSKNMEVYPGADRSSVMMTLPHKPGSLYKALARFNALGLNLLKLESRPLPQRDFEFMFYFDLEASVYDPAFLGLLDSLEEICDTFHYLGSYTEVI